MKKIIFIIIGVVIVVVLGRLGWAYLQVKTDTPKESNTSDVDSVPTNPTPPALPN